MLLPKKTKYRKAFKGRIHGNAKRGSSIAFGSFGLKAMEPERVTSRQIEAARKAINRYLRRAGKLWIRVFPDVPVSQKPAEVRMGSGKGSVEYYICRVKPGRILFELEGVTSAQAEEAFRLASGKLPIKTKFVERIVEVEGYDLDGINKNYIDTIDKNKVKEVNLDADDKVIKQNAD